MFTGLIEDVGILRDRQHAEQAGKLTVETELPIAEITTGESIAANGACLTVEKIDPATRTLTFHTLAETLSCTNLGSTPVGSQINLERALQLKDRLGGHLVSGHVDATAKILEISRETASDYILRVTLPETLASLTINKGSIAVNGISLTIAQITDTDLVMHIIPHTWEHTNLHSLKTGDTVNLEGDMVGKFLLRQNTLAKQKSSALTMDDLTAAGFNSL